MSEASERCTALSHRRFELRESRTERGQVRCLRVVAGVRHEADDACGAAGGGVQSLTGAMCAWSVFNGEVISEIKRASRRWRARPECNLLIAAVDDVARARWPGGEVVVAGGIDDAVGGSQHPGRSDELASAEDLLSANRRYVDNPWVLVPCRAPANDAAGWCGGAVTPSIGVKLG